MIIRVEGELEQKLRIVFKKSRRDAGLDQEAVANAGGMRRETYGRWEKGNHLRPLQEKPLLLAAYFILDHLPSEPDKVGLLDVLKKTNREITN